VICICWFIVSVYSMSHFIQN